MSWVRRKCRAEFIGGRRSAVKSVHSHTDQTAETDRVLDPIRCHVLMQQDPSRKSEIGPLTEEKEAVHHETRHGDELSTSSWPGRQPSTWRYLGPGFVSDGEG
jgi:hypothetical protein